MTKKKQKKKLKHTRIKTSSHYSYGRNKNDHHIFLYYFLDQILVSKQYRRFFSLLWRLKIITLLVNEGRLFFHTFLIILSYENKTNSRVYRKLLFLFSKFILQNTQPALKHRRKQSSFVCKNCFREEFIEAQKQVFTKKRDEKSSTSFIFFYRKTHILVFSYIKLNKKLLIFKNFSLTYQNGSHVLKTALPTIWFWTKSGQFLKVVSLAKILSNSFFSTC